MPRPRKNGEKISLYLDKDAIERLRINANDKGQTLTTALERAIDCYLSNDGERDPRQRKSN